MRDWACAYLRIADVPEGNVASLRELYGDALRPAPAGSEINTGGVLQCLIAGIPGQSPAGR